MGNKETTEVRGGVKHSLTGLGGSIVTRYYSTNDREKITDAILTLVMTECGFEVLIRAPAFNESGCLDRDSTLRLSRTGYGVGAYGPPDRWHVHYEGREVGVYDSPHEAVDAFFGVVDDRDMGHDRAELTGSGCPSALTGQSVEDWS